MPTEIEAKFLADGDGPLQALATAPTLGEMVLGPANAVDEVDRYLDTADGRLAAAGWACRLRTRGGAVRASLKGPPTQTDGDDWHHRRPEVEGPATDQADPSTWPPSAARDLVLRVSAHAPLVEHVRLEQHRTERVVRRPDGVAVATLSLDRVRVRAGDGGHGRLVDLGDLRVVELELDPAVGEVGEAALPELARAIGAVGGLVPDPRTKLEHAMELLAQPAER